MAASALKTAAICAVLVVILMSAAGKPAMAYVDGQPLDMQGRHAAQHAYLRATPLRPRSRGGPDLREPVVGPLPGRLQELVRAPPGSDSLTTDQTHGGTGGAGV
ncbi:hypothetical protein ACQJBY_034877 [Aegilops geniculata]